MIQLKPYKDCLSYSNKIKRLCWNICCTMFFRFFPGPLFSKWRVFVLRCWGAKIGIRCQIRSSARIWAPWNLKLGDYVAIGCNAQIYNVTNIEVGSKVVVSQGAYLCTASHDITHPDNPLITKPIFIENFAWVAADAFVGMGVTIGEGAVVGARAVVTKDVEPWTVVVGNPARFIKKRELRDA